MSYRGYELGILHKFHSSDGSMLASSETSVWANLKAVMKYLDEMQYVIFLVKNVYFWLMGCCFFWVLCFPFQNLVGLRAMH